MLHVGALECASTTWLALSHEVWRNLFENVDRYTEDIVTRRASISNRAKLVDRVGGIADLRQRNPPEREKVLVQCADSKHRSVPEAYLDGATDRGGPVPRDLDRSLGWHRAYRR